MKRVLKVCLFGLAILAVSIIIPGKEASADVVHVDREIIPKTTVLATEKVIVSPNKTVSTPTKTKSNVNRNISRGGGNMVTRNLVLSFYTDLPEENGGWGGITSIGTSLRAGVAASVNALPFGTTIVTQKFGTLVVEDRMNERVAYKRCKSGEIPVDVFVPRKKGESKSAYKKRVNNMGIQRVVATVFYPN